MRQAILIAALAYFAVLIIVYFAQRKLLYHPTRNDYSPEEVGLSHVEALQLATRDGETLAAWYAEAREGMPTILFFHGNGGDISGRTERFNSIRRAGYGVFILSYRGYGASSGSPSEAGLLTDAETAYQWLVSRGVPPARIAVVGESLGAGIAVQLSARKPDGAIALEAPFTSAADVARLSYWWLPVNLMMKDQFKSADHIGNLHAPLLIIHGTADESSRSVWAKLCSRAPTRQRSSSPSPAARTN